MKLIRIRNKKSEERGSLSLEQILFVGAIVAVGAGLAGFYGNISGYLNGVSFNSPPTYG